MTRLGYVYGNLMVNVHLKNEKLRERGVRILQEAAGMQRDPAQELLKQAGDSLPVALVMQQARISRAAATRALKSAAGNVRAAIAKSRP
jgi:N-acetylmuramic acid 6-phosphate etherase